MSQSLLLPVEAKKVNDVWDYRIWLQDPHRLIETGAAAAVESEYKMMLLNDASHVYKDVPPLCLTIGGKLMACRVIPADTFDPAQFPDCVGPFRYADFSRYLDVETCKLIQHMVGVYRSRQRGPMGGQP